MDQNSETSANAEDNLNNLLDSCLGDFNKPIPQQPSSAATNTSKEAKSEGTKPANKSIPADSPDAWSEEFKKFSKELESCLADGPEMEEVRKLVDGCLSQDGSAAGVDDEAFMKSFADSIQQLTEQAQNVPDPSPDDIANLLGNLGIGEGGGLPDLEGMPDFMPVMQSVMQKLMSKEMLYPSIKEVVGKYPTWLEEKKPSLPEDDYQRYIKQFELMQEICTEFERDLDPTEAAQKEQFEKVLQLMQKVQTYGNPPKELVANIGPGVPLDDQGNLQLPGMPEQCTIM